MQQKMIRQNFTESVRTVVLQYRLRRVVACEQQRC